MKKLVNILGVTLLEVMLVLAVAAMIILMSVKYYQSATTNQQLAALMNFVQAVTAAADSLSSGTGAYNSTDGATAANVTSLMPNTSMMLPWGATAVYAPASASTWTLSLPSIPDAVCKQFLARYKANPKYTVPSGCLTITYTSTAN